MQTLADSIRTLRLEAGLSQRRHSEASGVPINTLRQIEQGLTKNPRLETLRNLLQPLGRDVEFVVVADHRPSVDHGGRRGVSAGNVQGPSMTRPPHRNSQAPADAGERLTAGARHEGA